MALFLSMWGILPLLGDAVSTVLIAAGWFFLNAAEPGAEMVGYGVIGAGAVLLLVSMAAMSRLLAAATRAIRIRDTGEEVSAQVTGLKRTRVELNTQRQYRLTWRDDKGRTGQSLMRTKHRFADWPEGTATNVYVDPVSGESWWQGDVGPRSPDKGGGSPASPRRAPTVQRSR